MQGGCLRRFYKELRREAKVRGEKERYTQLNTEFQRTGWRNKKAFLNKQCKEIEENNRRGKTRDLFKKFGDIKGTSPARMGMIKDRNSKDLTKTEEIKKTWQEYTGKLYKKGLNDTDNHNFVVTHLEPDILECEVKWALRSIQFSSVTQPCLTLFNPTDCSMPGFPVHHQLPELAKLMPIKSVNVHQVSDAIQPSHSLPSPSPPAFNLSHHQGLFQ